MGIKFSLKFNADPEPIGNGREPERLVTFNVKRKFIVNGKEYASIEELPEDVRRIYQKATSGISDQDALPKTIPTKITYNGRVYDNPEEMPPEARQLYERLVREIRAGASSPGATAGQTPGVLTAGPTAPEPVFSRWLLVLGLLVILLTIVLYLRFH